ncbi:ABC transporter ATP-binding protein [Paenibacillus sp. alder61]|uniref:ABC transporter ATP-binding protein n=1 Tax=Paenibacillus faecis TaxID=862114 RepID=A0A5D0CQI4_9BACL|nr:MULTISPECIES: ABC transporter ATP-binding protein [Paenibacillus]MCA1293350.1 ABC transporter ATP-binding protein [Paenibacillus sp. alder61]TYA12018.1 ABC transporter ATP-binding protein [Paenibacillus faecis]
MSLFIEANQLKKRYGQKQAVNGLSLEIRRGEVLAMIGPNGAGKSTTLDLLLGLRRPDEGSVRYWCAEPRQHIGVQLQSTPFFSGFTARENMAMFAAFYGVRLSRRQINDLLTRCGLQDAGKTPAERLSGGQQKRLAIAIAMAHEPQLLFLDEPTAALDPRARREVRELVTSLAKAGTSVVFTSHDMEEVHKLATRVIMICGGAIIAEGMPDRLLKQYQAGDLEELYIRLSGE